MEVEPGVLSFRDPLGYVYFASFRDFGVRVRDRKRKQEGKELTCEAP